MDVIFIRHAETESNAGLKTSQPATISLTQKGKQSAVDFAANTGVVPELIIITPYLRTYQTASPFINKHPDVPVETWPLHEFTYLSPVACQNMTAEDRVPMVRSYWAKCDPYLIHGPGAESFSEFAERVSKSLEKMKSLGKRSTVVFTHGQVIRMIRQLTDVGNRIPSESMMYFRDRMLTLSVKNLEIVEFRF